MNYNIILNNVFVFITESAVTKYLFKLINMFL